MPHHDVLLPTKGVLFCLLPDVPDILQPLLATDTASSCDAAAGDGDDTQHDCQEQTDADIDTSIMGLVNSKHSLQGLTVYLLGFKQ